jgi:hydroxyacylglutathione hydrolase
MKINEHVLLVASGKMGFDFTHPSDCNVYLLKSGDELALIDSGTGDSVDEIIKNIESFGLSIGQVKKIFLTHIHADHAGGASLLKEKTGAEVFVYKEAYEILKAGDEQAIDLLAAKLAGFYPEDYQFTPCNADHLVDDGDELAVGDLKLRVIETPGHSRFDISFFIELPSGDTLLFSGDTVFYDGKISMLNTQDFNVQLLAKSVEKLSKLKVDTLLPGHYHPALKNGSAHIKDAHLTFRDLGIPKNIVV